jgi:hypothetical protein
LSVTVVAVSSKQQVDTAGQASSACTVDEFTAAAMFLCRVGPADVNLTQAVQYMCMRAANLG